MRSGITPVTVQAERKKASAAARSRVSPSCAPIRWPSRSIAGMEALRATYLEQFLVAISRGREGVRVYTDEKDALRERIVHSGQRGSATELMAGEVAANTRPTDVTERAMKDRETLRQRVAYRRKHEAHKELMRDRIAVGEGRRRGKWYERLVPRQEQGRGRDHGR
jgi:hypothetical protein